MNTKHNNTPNEQEAHYLDQRTRAFLSSVEEGLEEDAQGVSLEEIGESISITSAGAAQIELWLEHPVSEVSEIKSRQQACLEVNGYIDNQELEEALSEFERVSTRYESPAFYYNAIKSERLLFALFRAFCYGLILYGFIEHISGVFIGLLLLLSCAGIFHLEAKALRESRLALKQCSQVVDSLQNLGGLLVGVESPKLKKIHSSILQVVGDAPRYVDQLRNSCTRPQQVLHYLLDFLFGYSYFSINRPCVAVGRWLTASSKELWTFNGELGAYLFGSRLIRRYSFKMPEVLEPSEGQVCVIDIQEGLTLGEGLQPSELGVVEMEEGPLTVSFSLNQGERHFLAVDERFGGYSELWVYRLFTSLLWAQAGLPAPVASMSFSPVRLSTFSGDKPIAGGSTVMCLQAAKRLKEVLSQQAESSSVPELLLLNAPVNEGSRYEDTALLRTIVAYLKQSGARELELISAGSKNALYGNVFDEKPVPAVSLPKEFTKRFYRELRDVLVSDESLTR